MRMPVVSGFLKNIKKLSKMMYEKTAIRSILPIVGPLIHPFI